MQHSIRNYGNNELNGCYLLDWSLSNEADQLNDEFHFTLEGGVFWQFHEILQFQTDLGSWFPNTRVYCEDPTVLYRDSDLYLINPQLLTKHNEDLSMSHAPIMSNELLKVKTFQDLLSVRSLTGIMRLNEHHLNNGLSTFLREETYTINAVSDEQFLSVIAGFESMGYVLEVRTNTKQNKTLNAYRLDGEVVSLAVVAIFESNKLRYYGYATTRSRTSLEESIALIKPYVKGEPVVVNYVTGFNDSGAIVDHREIAMDKNIPLDLFYPFIDGGLDTLADGFIASQSNLLLLVGERGTGKTTLLREFCRRYKLGSIYQMCGDKVILSSAFDAYLASLPERSLIIIEDADAILGKRTDDNTSLSMLLNELDGIANKGSKFVITTNLENLKSVDNAILRVGRCYKTIPFRKLTPAEAETASHAIGNPNAFVKDISLAEIFNGNNQVFATRTGF